MSIPFTFAQLPTYLVEALKAQQITEPTNIQEKMIPEALDGQSVIARSQTGTGKTLAYVLPALAKMDREKKDLQVIILAPTQELAMQIVDVTRKLTEAKPIAIAALIGGANIKRQIERLKKQKPQFVVATPGRLLELIELRKLKVHEVQTVVIDEADRMIAEHSSWDATVEIAKRTGRQTQYLFVSATIPDNFTSLTERVFPFLIQLEAEGGLLHTDNVEHVYIDVEARDRIDVVRRIIHAETIKKGIVFTNKVEMTLETAEKLAYRKINALPLSSEQSKQEREKALQQFRDGKVNILVATDVAARGLDVDDVTHIIQLEAPSSSDNYLHRAGRTGRIGKSGTVITCITKKEQYKREKYEQELQITLKHVQLIEGKLIRS